VLGVEGYAYLEASAGHGVGGWGGRDVGTAARTRQADHQLVTGCHKNAMAPQKRISARPDARSRSRNIQPSGTRERRLHAICSRARLLLQRSDRRMASSPEIAAAAAKKNPKYVASCDHARARHAHESRKMPESSTTVLVFFPSINLASLIRQPYELSLATHSPHSNSTTHRPAPIMIVAVPSLMLVPANVTFMLCRSNSYATPSTAALIQWSSNRWTERSSLSANEILFDATSIQKCKISSVREELLPDGVSVITTLLVTHVRGTRPAALAATQIATRTIAQRATEWCVFLSPASCQAAQPGMVRHWRLPP
jgi:hypothetical protein